MLALQLEWAVQSGSYLGRPFSTQAHGPQPGLMAVEGNFNGDRAAAAPGAASGPVDLEARLSECCHELCEYRVWIRSALPASSYDRNPTPGVTPTAECYTRPVPTTHPRHAITETGEISAALEAARARWPDDRDRPARLLRRLIAEGHRSIAPVHDAARARRLDAIERSAGRYTDLYRPGDRERLRDEWPE